MESLPSLGELCRLQADLDMANPDAIVVWGRPGDSRYAALIQSLASQYPYIADNRIVDPILGEVGVIMFRTR
jgi:hypothetical protein